MKTLRNTNVKLISKALAKRIEKFLSSLVSPYQAAYSANRFISEGGRVVSDVKVSF